MILTKSYARNHKLVGRSKRGLDRREAFCPLGKGIRIEDYARSLGESVSNSSTIPSRTRRFSPDQSDRTPKPRHPWSLCFVSAATELSLKRFGEERLQSYAAAGSKDFGPTERGLREFDGRFHVTIFRFDGVQWDLPDGARIDSGRARQRAHNQRVHNADSAS